MGSLHGFSLLLLATSLVFSGVLGSSSRPALCDFSCCSVWPTCDNARVVACDCPNMMTLRKGDIPQTVREVNIHNTRKVTIDKDAISGLQYLTNFTLSDIDELEIKQDGMASHDGSELRSVTFQKIGTLRVESKAFSGVWQSKTTIQMLHIGVLNVESNAFDYQVVEHGPSVLLQHVQMLNLESNGFAAPLYALDMNNLTMDVCRNESFHVSADFIFWNKVNIPEAYARCFYCTNSKASFTIKSLIMKYAHSIAFSGNVRKLTIKDSHFITIHGKGFDFEVEKMELINSYIEDLHSDGLHVLATDIRIEYVLIDHLWKNALSGLQMKHGSVADHQRLLFNQMHIKRAENGSLVLSETANLQNLQMNNTHVMSRKNPVCPIEKYARMLTDASSIGPLSYAQQTVASSLTGSNRCPDDYKNIDKAPEAPSHESEAETASHEHVKNASSHESEGETVSQESEEPIPNESQDKVDNGAPDVADINKKKKQAQVELDVLLPSLAAVLMLIVMTVLLVMWWRRRDGESKRVVTDIETW